MIYSVHTEHSIQCMNYICLLNKNTRKYSVHMNMRKKGLPNPYIYRHRRDRPGSQTGAAPPPTYCARQIPPLRTSATTSIRTSSTCTNAWCILCICPINARAFFSQLYRMRRNLVAPARYCAFDAPPSHQVYHPPETVTHPSVSSLPACPARCFARRG